MTIDQFAALLFLFLLTNAHVFASTPLCLLCPCNSQPNEPPNINCASTKIDNIFDPKFWFNGTNSSYPINSVSFRSIGLGSLKVPFPPSNLTYLDISDNFISEIVAGAFSGLQKMESLNLANNNIASINSNAFRGVYDKSEYFPLKALRILDLNNNKFHTFDADVFEHIDELETLILSNNPFKIIDAQTLSAIASLVNLKMLDLSNTQIKSLPDHFMLTPRLLKVLNLSKNNFDAIPKALQESRALETLYFDYNPIVNLSGLNIFPPVSTLKTLYMSHMANLVEVGSSALGGLKNLEVLHMSNNSRLRVIHREAFVAHHEPYKSLSKLRKVFIDHNNISHLEKDTLPNLAHIEELDIRSNPWACDCESEWLINAVTPACVKTNWIHILQLKCAGPEEMKGAALYNLYQNKSITPCAHGETQRGGYMLMGTVIIITAAVLLVIVTGYVHTTRKINYRIFAYFPSYNRV